MRLLILVEEILNSILESIVTLFFAFILCLTVLLVLLRYGFNSSLIWGSEAMNYLFIYTTALGAAVAVSRKTHIRISCFVDLTKGKLHSFLNFIAYGLIGLINGVLGWYSLPWITSVGSFESPIMRIPIWAVQISVPLGCGLALVYCLLHMIRILTGREPERGPSC